MYWVVISFLLSFFLWLTSSFFSVDEESVNANYSFECGMDCLSPNRAPFCMHFFIISVLFLVFDVELMVSLPLSWVNISKTAWLFFLYIFLLILLVGLFLEIFLDSLEWDTKM